MGENGPEGRGFLKAQTAKPGGTNPGILRLGMGKQSLKSLVGYSEIVKH